MFKNHLLHVIGGEGDFYDALQLLADIEEDSEAHHSASDDGCRYIIRWHWYSDVQEMVYTRYIVSMKSVNAGIFIKSELIDVPDGSLKEMHVLIKLL